MINQETNIDEETKLKLRIMSGYSNIKYLKHKSKNRIVFSDESIRKFIVFDMDNNTVCFKDKICIFKYDPFPHNEENEHIIRTVEFMYDNISGFKYISLVK